MMILNRQTFLLTILAGVVATYVMTVAGVWQGGLGLKAMDPSGLMIKSLNKAHPENPMYGIGFGHLYHYLNAIALALLYVVAFRRPMRLPTEEARRLLKNEGLRLWARCSVGALSWSAPANRTGLRVP